MREFKFRGKSIKEFGNNLVGTWFYGGIIINPHGNEVHIAYFDKDMLSWRNVPVDPETVGQYTELKDKNGKDIYEGDILKTTFVNVYKENGIEVHRGVVKFNPRNGYYLNEDGDVALIFEDKAEIIGNVYKNK